MAQQVSVKGITAQLQQIGKAARAIDTAHVATADRAATAPQTPATAPETKGGTK